MEGGDPFERRRRRADDRDKHRNPDGERRLPDHVDDARARRKSRRRQSTRADAHHHMICRNCGRIEDVDASLDLERARHSAARTGFEPDRAEVVVSGLCATCAREQR